MADDNQQTPEEAAYMNGWNFGSRVYLERLDDPTRLMREALRRAVDTRDKLPGANLGARPVMLVDVLNALSDALDLDTYASLWSDWDRANPEGV